MMTEILFSLVASAAISTLLILILLLRAFIKPYKKAKMDYAFSDLLDYAKLLKSECILLKNGSLLRIYKVKPKCYQTIDESSLELHQSLISKALYSLDKNYAVHFEFIRERHKNTDEDVSYFGPDTLKRLFLKRFSKINECFENSFYLCVTKHYKNVAPDLFLLQENAQDALFEIEEDFLKHEGVLISTLSDSLDLEKCTYSNTIGIRSHDAITFLKKCVSLKSTETNLPSQDFYVDSEVAFADFVPGLYPKIGDEYLCVIALDGFPTESSFCMIDALTKLDFEYRLSARFVYFDDLTSDYLINKSRRLFAQKKRGFFDQLLNRQDPTQTVDNSDALEQIEDIKKAKKKVLQNQLRFGAYSGNLIIGSKNLKDLEYKKLEAIKAISSISINARVETINATEAYLGSLPGHTFENLRRNFITNETFTDLLPVNASFTGDKYSPNLKFGEKAPPLMLVKNDDHRCAYLNLHVQDLANCLLIGPPGSGKSVFLGSLIISLLRYKGMRVFAFDKGCSFYALTKVAGGNHLYLGEDNSISFCPLHRLDDVIDREKAIDFIMFLLTLSGLENYKKAKEKVREAINTIAKVKTEAVTLTDVKTYLCDDELEPYLSPFLSSNDHKYLLDGSTNPDLKNSLTTIELGEFLNKSQIDVMATFACLFHLIDEAILENEATAIIIDEAWLLLNNEVFQDKLIEWIKTLRKHNAMVILATQSISDISKTSNYENFIDTIKTRVYLPNSDAIGQVLSPVYKDLMLNDRQIKLISMAKSKKDLFIHKDNTFMPFNLLLSSAELSLLSLTQKDMSMVNDLYERNSSNFVWNL